MENSKPHNEGEKQFLNVLIVEDEPELADLLRQYLENRDYAVALATSVYQAREGLYEMSPDIVFLDINLPDGSGVDLIPLLRRNHNCRIIAMSADNHNMNDALGGKFHADVFLIKPFKLETVGKTLDILDPSTV